MYPWPVYKCLNMFIVFVWTLLDHFYSVPVNVNLYHLLPFHLSLSHTHTRTCTPPVKTSELFAAPWGLLCLWEAKEKNPSAVKDFNYLFLITQAMHEYVLVVKNSHDTYKINISYKWRILNSSGPHLSDLRTAMDRFQGVWKNQKGG